MMVVDIKEAVNANDVVALKTLAGNALITGSVFVEVGSWKGHSASVVASLFNGTGAHLWCVDHWLGNEGVDNIQVAKEQNIYDLFESNLRALELWQYIRPLKMDSLEGSRQFEDNSIDFLFIDADHRYEPFLADLMAWYPKIRLGGTICGHDCEIKYSPVSPGFQERINRGLTTAFDGSYHAGVIKGLFDYFHDEYDLFPQSRVWHRRKE